MFTTGIPLIALGFFSAASMAVALPSGIQVFAWIGTLAAGKLRLTVPALFVLGFLVIFTIGGLTGVMLGLMPFDLQVHDTYFVVAHFHYIMVGGTVSAYFGALHYWWPKMFGRTYSRAWGRITAIFIYFGFNLTFFPQFILGYFGMPRRYHVYDPAFQYLHVLSSAGASILGIAYILPFAYLYYSLRHGAEAGPNPWDVTGLEWTTASPPPKHNFEVLPVVTSAPYGYPVEMEDQHG
jgi:cytochrome c oxidase subunit 1